MAEKIISKGFYTHPGIPNFVSVKQYVMVRKGTDNQLFFRFENPKNERLTAISFSVDCYDVEGRVIKTAKIEQNNLKVKGHSCFIVNRPVVLDNGVVDFKVTINSAGYGDYCYITHGDEIEVIYEKQEGVEEIDRVPFLHKLGGRTHRAASKTVHTPRFFIALTSVVVLTLFLILGIKIYNFMRTEELFTLDMIEYTFATDDRKDGPIILVGCNSDAGNIIVPDSIEGHDVVGIGAKAFAKSNVRTIHFKGSIEIKDNAFVGASKLQKVTIDSTRSIGVRAFYGCQKLSEITVNNDLVSIGESAFETCSSLSKVSFPNSLQTVGSRVFGSCYSLTSLTIPESATSIGEYILYNCRSLTSLEVPFIGPSVDDARTLSYFYNSSTPYALVNVVVTKMKTIPDNMFYGESYIESIVYKAPVTHIGAYAFADCINLQAFDIPASVEEVGYGAFRNCSSIKSVVIPENVTTISDSVFSNCSSLRSVTIPSSVTHVGDHAFENCLRVEELVFPATVTYMGNNALRNCTGLRTLVLPFLGNTIESSPRTLYDIISYGTNSNLTSFTLLSCENIPDHAFQEFGKLTSITLPADALTIGSNCFANCVSLTDIDIPSRVTTIGYGAFNGCSSLNDIEIPRRVEEVGAYAFSGCEKLTSAVFRNSETNIGIGIFSDCKQLASLTLPSDIDYIPMSMCQGCESIESIILPTEVTEISEYAFSGCTLLKRVTLPANLRAIGSYAFQNCSTLPAFTFTDDVESIGDYAFSGCSSIQSITIPETIASIGYAVFENCSSVSRITAPFPSVYSGGATFSYYFGYQTPSSLKSINVSSVASLVIPGYAFSGFTGVEELTLPDDIISIGESAFMNCSSLTSLVIPDSVESMGMGMLIGTSSLDSIVLPYAGPQENSSYGFRYFYEDYYSYYAPSKLSTVTLTKATSIPAASFYSMSSIHHINIPDTLESIGNYAFQYCTSLNEIVLPESLTYLGYDVFTECYKLFEATNLSENVEPYFPYALRVFTSEHEKNYERISLDGYSFVLANDGNWYLTDYDHRSTVHELPGNVRPSGTYSINYCIPERLFYNDTNVQRLHISHAVSKILPSAFASCSSLTKVTSDIAPSLEEIGDHAFENASSLSEVTIPISTMRIGDYAFYRTGINSIYIPTTVETIGQGAFESCSSLTSLSFSSNSQLETIGSYAFYSTRITSLSLPASLVTIGDYAFQNCSYLNTLSFASGSQLETMGSYAFSNTGIQTVSLPASLTNVSSYAFYNCRYLGSVRFADNNQLEAIGSNAFYDCVNMISVNLGSNSSLQTIGSYAFGNTGIQTVSLPASLTTVSSYAFYNCRSLGSVRFADNNQLEAIGSNAFYDCVNLISVNFGSNSSLETIGSEAFRYTKINYLTLPASLSEINSSAFRNCSYLLSVTVEDDSQLSYVYDSAFRECSALISVDFGDNNQLYGIYSYAFYNCYSLTDIDFGSNSSLHTIGSEAFRNTKINYLTLPASLVEIGSSAFRDCYSLTTVDFSDNSQLHYVYGSAFRDCYSLTTVDFGSNSQLQTINSYAFRDCYSLTTVDFGSNSQLQTINSYAFYGTAITEIDLPGTLTDVYSCAFGNCSNLSTVILRSTSLYINSYAFSSSDYYASGHNIIEVYDLGGLGISAGSSSYGYVAQNAIIVHTNEDAEKLQDVEVNGFRFKKSDDNWFLMGLAAGNNPTHLVLDSFTYGGEEVNSYIVYKNAFAGNANIQSVFVGSAVSEIMTGAFLNCYNLYDVMDMCPAITITAGTSYNGNVAYYALAVRESDDPLDVTEITKNGTTAKFVQYENNWYLINLTSSTDTVDIPELVIESYNFEYHIFKYALQAINGNTMTYITGLIIPGTVSGIDSGSFDNLSNVRVFYGGSADDWAALGVSTYLYVYTYVDCVHEYNTWTYDEGGNISTALSEWTSEFITEPTCKDPGEIKYTCTLCGEERSEELPVTSDHSVGEDNVCTICGKERQWGDVEVTSDNFNSLSCITNNSSYPFGIDESGVITSQNHYDSSTSTMTITATHTMTVSFSYSVSSEGSFDKFTLTLNNIQQFQISGTGVSYNNYSVTLNAGDVLTFSYSKDGSVSNGQDCAYIKDLVVQDWIFVDPQA